MRIFEKMGQFLTPEGREDRRKMNEAVESAEKLIKETSLDQAREESENSLGQAEVIRGARSIAEKEGNQELDALARFLRGILDEGNETNKSTISSIEEDFGWSEARVKQRLSIILEAVEELGRKKFDSPDENEIRKGPAGEPVTRDTRSKIHDIVIDLGYGEAIAMEIDPLIDMIVENRLKQYKK